SPSLHSNLPPPPHSSTLSLHDALPISLRRATRDVEPHGSCARSACERRSARRTARALAQPSVRRDRHRRNSHAGSRAARGHAVRSEEHTSELQSRENLVCRLLLEKKKK